MRAMAMGFLVLGFLVACGGGSAANEGDDDRTGDDDDDDQSATAKYSCCLNDVYYACPDQQAFEACAGGPDPGECLAKCDPSDLQCADDCFAGLANASHDPSQCEKRTGERCPETSGGGGGSCIGSGGRACDIDADCGSGEHCTDSHCFDNEAGSKCDIDADCGSGNHCTNSCCLSNEEGESCDIDADCGSGNHCSDSKCYANESGNPCDIDADCGSNSACVDSRCN